MNPWATVGVAVLVLLASHWGAYEHGRSVELAQAAQASAQRDSGDRLAEVLGERSAREEEQRRAEAQEDARAHAREEHKVADVGAAGADAAGQRLQHDAANFAATVRCPGPDPAIAARGEAATRAAMVLSDLLARSVDTNRDLAAAYDRARVAGLACETAYRVLSKPAS